MPAKFDVSRKYDFNPKQTALAHEIAKRSLDNMKLSGCVEIKDEGVFLTHQIRLVSLLIESLKNPGNRG